MSNVEWDVMKFKFQTKHSDKAFIGIAYFVLSVMREALEID